MTPIALTPLIALEAVALDTETTGLDPRVARLVQLGAVRLRSAAVVTTERFDTLVAPGLPIPPTASAIHGISDADVAAAPDFAAVAPALAGFIGRQLLIGHTIGFDLEILRQAHARAGLPWEAPPALDVRLLARLAAPNLAQDHLDALCTWLDVPPIGRHSAIGDALITAHVFVALLPRLREAGIRTVAEAQAGLARLIEREARAGGGLMAAPPAPPPPAALARLDSFPYRHRVQDVMRTPAAAVTDQVPLAEAIARLRSDGISSLFVVRDGGDGATGIVTERDVLGAIAVLGAAALARPVGSVASFPLECVRADDFVYRAIGRMNRLGLRHLGVRDAGGALVGALTPRNLLRQRASTAIAMGDAIDSATDAPALARAWAGLTATARGLLDEDVEPARIAAVISEELRAASARAAALAEAEMLAQGHGPAPARFCVLVLGSAGRGESLLAADQDNALVWVDDAPAEADGWFAAMAARMNSILDEAGIVLCKGGVMARNAAWQGNLATWRERVAGWLRRRRGEDLLNVDIFFDGVGVHGDGGLADVLFKWADDAAHRAPDFVALMAMHIPYANPFTLLGRPRHDEDGRIDLKRHGLLPIAQSARALAMRHGVHARASVARLQAVSEHGVGGGDIAAIIAAQETLLGAVLRQQLRDLEVGIPPGTKVRLDRAERAPVIEALRGAAAARALSREGMVG